MPLLPRRFPRVSRRVTVFFAFVVGWGLLAFLRGC